MFPGISGHRTKSDAAFHKQRRQIEEHSILVEHHVTTQLCRHCHTALRTKANGSKVTLDEVWFGIGTPGCLPRALEEVQEGKKRKDPAKKHLDWDTAA